MTGIQTLVDRVKLKFSNQFIRNVGWLAMAEAILRVLRLGVTVILARLLTPHDYGLAAIVMTITELTRVLTDVGCWPKIIQADEKELNDICNSAYWLNWVVFSGLFITQCIAAFPIAWFYRDSQLILPICVAAIPYLMTPFCAIQWALIHRESRLKISAITSVLFNTTVYVISIIFAFQGLGIWAIVLPPVLASPVGTLIYYSNHSWRINNKFSTKHWQEIFSFGKNILGVQLLKTLRNNLDYLIVGRFIGINELGIYFFAFNAGLGISLSIINSLNAALLPHLCEIRSEFLKLKERYQSSLKTMAFIIIPLVLLQTTLAPFYVPIVFGQKWVVGIPVLMLICLSAIPRPFADAASQLLVAIGKPHLDFKWNIIFTALFTGVLFIGVQWQAIGVATSVLLVHAICLPLFTWWATRYVFRKA